MRKMVENNVRRLSKRISAKRNRIFPSTSDLRGRACNAFNRLHSTCSFTHLVELNATASFTSTHPDATKNRVTPTHHTYSM